MMLLGRKHTTSTVAVRERIRKAQRNVTIRIPFSALSEGTQKQLIEFEEEERWHKQKYAAKKLASFKFRDEDFDALPRENDSSESSMSRYLMHAHADEGNRDEKGYEEESKVLVEEEDEKDNNNVIDDVLGFHAPVSRFSFPNVPFALPPPPIPSPPPVPPVPDEIEIIDVDLLDK